MLLITLSQMELFQIIVNLTRIEWINVILNALMAVLTRSIIVNLAH